MEPSNEEKISRIKMIEDFRHAAAERMPGRKWLLLGAVGSLIFVLYGSLVPLDFQYRPIHEAWTEFKALLSAGFFIRSRADLGANFLLMVPAGFFGFGFLRPSGPRPWAIFLAATVWMMCLSASVAIEFVQVFFRGRTPAFSDILMQALGSSVGIAAWWLWGRKIWRRYFHTDVSGPPMGIAEKFLWVYLVTLFVYNIVPLDLTISPYEIYRKFKAGRIILIPFSFGYGSFPEFLYAVSTDIAVWVPAGFLWVFTGIKTPSKAWLWTFSAVTITEGVQLFVASRIFSITDIITGAIGGAIGVFIYLKIPLFHAQSTKPSTQPDSRYKLTWIGIGLFFTWCFALALIFWFPYEIQIERKLIESQIDRFFRVPFYAYYYSRPLQALSAVLQKTLFFVPLGVFLAIASRPFRKAGVNSLLAVISFLICTGVGLTIELGQVMMPNKIPDSTDLLLETGGGIFGYWIACVVMRRMDDV